MRVRAVTNFSGAISMSKGEERDITNDVLLKDLLQAGYVEEVATSQDDKSQKKGVKSNENK